MPRSLQDIEKEKEELMKHSQPIDFFKIHNINVIKDALQERYNDRSFGGLTLSDIDDKNIRRYFTNDGIFKYQLV